MSLWETFERTGRMITYNAERMGLFGQAVNTSSIISCTDTGGMITYVNHNFCLVSGYSVEELLGSSYMLVDADLTSQPFWNEMQQTIFGNRQWRGEIKTKTKSGDFYWLDTFIYPICDYDGKVIEFLSICNDITPKKKQELELLHKKNILAKVAWQQSHGLRRPVSSILGLIQLFEDEGHTEGDVCKLMEHLKKMSTELDVQIKEIVRLTEEISNANQA